MQHLFLVSSSLSLGILVAAFEKQLHALHTTLLGDLRIPRLITGLWNVCNNDFKNRNDADIIAKMTEYADLGLCTFDASDVIPRSEELVGKLNSGRSRSYTSNDCQFFTSFTPIPASTTKKQVNNAVYQSLRRMKLDTIDLLQLNWWDYDSFYYFNVIGYLMQLQDEGIVRNIGLSNFDTEHLHYLLQEEAPIVSNQVSFSIIDSRPHIRLVQFCEENRIKLLCYGCLLGGFISPYWLGREDPAEGNPEITKSEILKRYLLWIKLWGSWHLFQDLLRTLQSIAEKHSVSSLSLVALRWVLQQSDCVAGAIVGLSFQQKTFELNDLLHFTLDDEDIQRIEEIQRRGNYGGQALWRRYGDCGNEFRRDSRLQKRRYEAVVLH